MKKKSVLILWILCSVRRPFWLIHSSIYAELDGKVHKYSWLDFFNIQILIWMYKNNADEISWFFFDQEVGVIIRVGIFGVEFMTFTWGNMAFWSPNSLLSLNKSNSSVIYV
jgi:hypothetical protein